LERGEVEDCAVYMIRRVKEAMAEVPEGEGRDWIEGGSPVGMIFLKKKEEY
jgi:hypothetical protein